MHSWVHASLHTHGYTWANTERGEERPSGVQTIASNTTLRETQMQAIMTYYMVKVTV